MKTILLCLIIFTSVAHSKELSLTDHNSLTAIKSVSLGEQIQVTDVDLDHLGTVTLNLKRFKVFADNAEVLIHGDQGAQRQAMPNNVYFSGDIKGLKNSHVFIGFLENGEISGFVKTDNHEIKELRQTQNNYFKLLSHDQNKATLYDAREWNPKDFLELPDDIIQQRPENNTSNRSSIHYELTLAIETDYEFYRKFNSKTAAINYIGGLVGYISNLYHNEVKTAILLGEVTIWETSNDPWDATTSQCALYEVGQNWNENKQHVNRATTHFMSGKSLGGGIAWREVLCTYPHQFNIDVSSCPGLDPTKKNYFGAYGVTGSLSGNFNPGNPQIVWDLFGISHEIGHNFGSKHTHCFGGIDGNNNPVDQCFNGESAPGCFTGTKTLPGPAGQGSGTLMSYCHLLGSNNVSFTLGKNHPYGVQPDRVPNAMREHVEEMANFFPQCITPAAVADDLIFRDGFDQ